MFRCDDRHQGAYCMRLLSTLVCSLMMVITPKHVEAVLM